MERARHAVNGVILDGGLYKACSHLFSVFSDIAPWWQVDLAALHVVLWVTIYNDPVHTGQMLYLWIHCVFVFMDH